MSRLLQVSVPGERGACDRMRASIWTLRRVAVRLAKPHDGASIRAEWCGRRTRPVCGRSRRAGAVSSLTLTSAPTPHGTLLIAEADDAAVEVASALPPSASCGRLSLAELAGGRGLAAGPMHAAGGRALVTESEPGGSGARLARSSPPRARLLHVEPACGSRTPRLPHRSPFKPEPYDPLRQRRSTPVPCSPPRRDLDGSPTAEPHPEQTRRASP